MDSRRLGGSKDRAQVSRVFHPIYDHQERRFASCARRGKHLFRLGVRLCRNQSDNTLMLPSRAEPIQGLLWLNVDRHPGGPSQPDEVRELTILS